MTCWNEKKDFMSLEYRVEEADTGCMTFLNSTLNQAQSLSVRAWTRPTSEAITVDRPRPRTLTVRPFRLLRQLAVWIKRYPGYHGSPSTKVLDRHAHPARSPRH